ncbi:hypothetical protein B296_00054735 [Ensete ventricosum]|uniref:Uncharacterized protein n=1 Tax=Ensete ventricosum TaxID=4639 RepID=A0A426WXG3_ENSVE|nr:hypothetical protein B296_00054735 [Ensete ventricosum]
MRQVLLPSGGTSQAGNATLRGCCPYRSGHPCKQQPWSRALPMPAGVSYARGRPRMLSTTPARGFGRGRPPPCRGPWSQSAAWGLALANDPSSSLPSMQKHRRSYIPIFQIRMEKTKEVKRPPLYDRLCLWPRAATLGRQPLRAGDAASCSHLIRRPTHGHYASRRLPLRVGVML